MPEFRACKFPSAAGHRGGTADKNVRAGEADRIVRLGSRTELSARASAAGWGMLSPERLGRNEKWLA